MKFLNYIFFFFIVSSFSAQTSFFNSTLKLKLEDSKFVSEPHTLLVYGDIQKLNSNEALYDYKVNYFEGNIASITCKLNSLSQLIEHKIISYVELIPSTKKLLNDTMIHRNRLKTVKLWTAPLPQAYNGTNVVVGIIDSGLDFNHADFKDAQGNTRIKFLWDQNGVAGSAIPQPFNYGLEWTSSQINSNQCTHSDLPYFGHGTHVAGIAAGNGLANGTHEGIASKADIIAVALDFNKQGPTIADAVKYIFSKANAINKPCVINISLGEYYGSHDGTDLEAKLIDGMVKNISGRCIVAAAGNAGTIKFHTKTQVLQNDTNFTWINNGSSQLNYWCYADTNQIKNIKITVGANRANFFDLGRLTFKNYNYGFGTIKNDTLKRNNQRIGIIKTSASINPYGVYELFIQINADTTNLNWRIETTGSGLHHAWNFNFVASNLPNIIQYPKINKYVKPDSICSMVSSFQNSDEIITVANYANLTNYYDVNNALQTTGEIAGRIMPNSSHGPTRDNRIKPDIAATGDNVYSSLALGMQANLIANAPQVVAQGSMHVQGGGTSSAAPVVAGLAALYLQRYPNATNQQIKEAIRNCAYADNFTGTNLPNYKWGFGKLDGKASMYCGENYTLPNSIFETRKNTISYSPNPFKNELLIKFETPVTAKIDVYTLDGRLLFSDNFNSETYSLISQNNLENYRGLLLIKIIDGFKSYSIKAIKGD